MELNDPSGRTDYQAELRFIYEDRPDVLSNRRAGFEQRSTKRVAVIEIVTRIGGKERLYRRYRFAYHPVPDFGNGVSLLAQVTVEGEDDDGEVEALPPLALTYTGFAPDRRSLLPITGPSLPGFALNEPSAELVDVFACGLPSVLQLNGLPRYWTNLGEGRLDLPRSMAAAPAGLRLDDPGVALLDADGDGRADLLTSGPPLAGYYPLGNRGLWDSRSFQPYRVAPSFSFKDPLVRLIDLDGDGVTDALRSGSRIECFFNDPASGWSEVRFLERGALPGLDLDFTDPRIHLADMSGDGLQDVVLVHGGSVVYWPALGYGRFGTPVRMRNSPRLPDFYDPRRIILGDIDGDGVADFIYVGDGRIQVWLSQTGHGWSEPCEIIGTPPVSDGDAVRLCDWLGQGIAGLLFSAPDRSGARGTLSFLDLTGGSKPYLLAGMSSAGLDTRISWAPSTRFYLADQQDRATRWRTSLPFPVQVVAELVRTDRITGTSVSSSFRYRHGYWDGVEREFRGFGRVAQSDQGSDPEQAPVVSTSWFHLGPVGGAQDWDVPTFADEYWPGDAPYLPVPPLPAGLDRRAQRDAQRAMRGTLLRAELFAADGSPEASRPYMVTESVFGCELQLAPMAGRPGAFFPHVSARRTSEWERGDEPLTRVSFWDHYDAFGQPCLLTDVAVPRGRDYRRPGPAGEPYLATFTVADYAVPVDAAVYRPDRVARVTRRACANDGSQSLLELHDAVLADTGTGAILAQALHYYDGGPFVGLPYGQTGAHGLCARSEQLAFSSATLLKAYAGDDTAPIPPYLVPAGPPPWTGEYPEEFRNSLPPLAGYVYHDGSAGPASEGYWVLSERSHYDIQDGDGFGLLLGTLDALGNPTTYAFDDTRILPVAITDARGMVNRTDYDPRWLLPRLLTDANGNRELTQRTPLAMPASRAVMGRPDEIVGDTPDQPSTRWLYDLAGQPGSVGVIQRFYHVNDQTVPEPERSRVLQQIQYQDGFGRALQVRVQAEAPRGDRFGSFAAHGATPSAAVGGEVPSVAVSAAQLYDAKGRVTTKYQPCFASGWAYEPSAHGATTSLAYDPRGRLRLVTNPDGSQRLSVAGVPLDLRDPSVYRPTPWDTYLYDENDNGGRTDPQGSSSYASHWNTPGSRSTDALYRVVRSVVRLGTAPADELVTLQRYDGNGNVVEVIDPLGRSVLQACYDLRQQRLRTELLDAGVSRSITDAAGHPIEVRAGNGALTLSRFDVLGRAVQAWARDREDAAVAWRRSWIYGDDPASGLSREQAMAANLLGHIYLDQDTQGGTSYPRYDFQGHQVAKERRITGFDGVVFATDATYDAIGNVTSLTSPADVLGARHVLALSYNQAGIFCGSTLDGSPLVAEVAYNAKGDRTLLSLAEGVSTRWEYDPLSFRLLRLMSDAAGGTVLQRSEYGYDLTGNLLSQRNTAPDDGLPDHPDLLERRFRYDPLYRLLDSSGREAGLAVAPPWRDDCRPQELAATRAYDEVYTYDRVGNLSTLTHNSSQGSFQSTNVVEAGSNRIQHLLTQGLDIAYAYDGSGNVLAEGGRHFTWDYRNLLIAFAGDDGQQVVYQRDGDGARLVTRQTHADSSELTTISIDNWFEHRQLILADGSTSTNTTLLLRDGQQLLAVRRYGPAFPGDDTPDQTMRLVDRLGSNTLVLGASGWSNREEYAPYGSTVLGSFPGKRFRFTGNERDQASGLYDTPARAYAPYLGRWFGCDPDGIGDGTNLYAYVSGNPMRLVDVSGQNGDEPQQSNSARSTTTGVQSPGASLRLVAEGFFNSVKYLYHPTDHKTGAWLGAPYRLWSGSGQTEATNLAKLGDGYIMGQTKYHQQALRILEGFGWQKGGRLPTWQWEYAWAMTSRLTARDAVISGMPVTTHGTALPTSIQTTVEIPTIFAFGFLRGALVALPGVASVMGAASARDRTDRAALVGGGMMQIIAAKIGIIGTSTMMTPAMYWGVRLSLMGGVISAVPSLRSLPGHYQRSEWSDLMINSGASVSPMM